MAQADSNQSKSDSGCLERKSVDTSGRLGSLYDAFTDQITDQNTVKPSATKSVAEPYTCRTFSGSRSNTLISYLKWMDFNDAIKQSILFGMIKPSGVSRLIDHNQPIDDNTRFFYYSYRSKEEELDVTPEETNQIISQSSSSIHATHMITRVVWGFEILCVIPTQSHMSADTVDNLLQRCAKELKSIGGDLLLNDNEKRQITKILAVTVYGSETCIIHKDTKLSEVLKRLKDWQNATNLHHPLKYTMCSLRQLSNNKQFPQFFDLIDQSKPDIDKVYSIISNLDACGKRLEKLFEKLPTDFWNENLAQQLKHLRDHFSTFFNLYEDFRKDSRTILIDVRQKGR